MMTRDEFEKLIEAYGSQDDRWPELLKPDMDAFVQANLEEANSILQDEAPLDHVLDHMVTPPPTDLLKARILRQARTVNQSLQQDVIVTRYVTPWGRIAAMLLVAFAAGFGGAQFIGFSSTDIHEGPENLIVEIEQSSESEWQLAATELGMTEIYEWASGETVELTSLSDSGI